MKIPVAEPFLDKEEADYVLDAVKSGWLSSKGKYIEEFEERFSRYIGKKHGIATSNGTTALHLALSALNISKGDEVIIPTLTFIATANTVAYCGATPVFVDSVKDYWCMDPKEIEKKITKKTKAIVIVHLYGHPCDIEAIMKIAKKYKLYVIEDVAEAHGSEFKNKKAGSFGDISCFSFYGNKIITTGEGGMCLTDNRELAEKMKILRSHGMNTKKRYWHDVIGFNYRMTNIQAALGVAQLKKIDNIIEKRRKLAKTYSASLKELEEKNAIQLHPEMPWAKCVYWMYSIVIKDKSKVSRDSLIKYLESRGIETRPFFYPIHIMPMYRTKEKYPVAEYLSKRGINLPSSFNLSEESIEFILDSIKKIVS